MTTPEGRIRVYTGTTLENFLTCAVEVDNGLYKFIKSREPRYAQPQTTYFADSLEGALGHTMTELVGKNNPFAINDHTPAVISGELSDKFKKKWYLPSSMHLLIDEVWLPMPERDWKLEPNILDFLIRHPAREVIERYSGG